MNSNKCPYLKKECERTYNPNKCLTNYQKCWEYGRLTFVKNQSQQIKPSQKVMPSEAGDSYQLRNGDNPADIFYDSQVKSFEETEIFGSLEEKTISGDKICSENPK